MSSPVVLCAYFAKGVFSVMGYGSSAVMYDVYACGRFLGDVAGRGGGGVLLSVVLLYGVLCVWHVCTVPGRHFLGDVTGVLYSVVMCCVYGMYVGVFRWAWPVRARGGRGWNCEQTCYFVSDQHTSRKQQSVHHK